MDIDEWEFLSDDGYLDFNEDSEKKIFIGKGNLVSKSVLDVNHFCPTSPRKPRVLNQLVPLQIPLEPKIGNTPDDELVQGITKDHPMEVKVVVPSEKIKDFKFEPSVEAEQETASQVFFKIKENEFVDMKMDSPRSSSRGLLKFEDKGEAMEIITSPRMKKIEKDMIGMECDKEEDCSTWEEENTNGFNIWKWSLTGVGAICSFGVAAATICVLFFGTKQRNKTQNDQKIRFQIYTEDKGIKQVVQHATKLNEAISVVRGVPVSTARVTIGGYYDGL
ncbi:uncharacterized protein LOC133296054 [Gastrolobium bilobum]|uniref:uncharacterized protein LOC133296054 n=1 Tax=Gastrolobium bilobum TaxID=150636 RepID=UPI002AAFA5C5|nr:uncharacterized protein LOC133296054 [Gastrolobium bilobum]